MQKVVLKAYAELKDYLDGAYLNKAHLNKAYSDGAYLEACRRALGEPMDRTSHLLCPNKNRQQVR